MPLPVSNEMKGANKVEIKHDKEKAKENGRRKVWKNRSVKGNVAGGMRGRRKIGLEGETLEDERREE